MDIDFCRDEFIECPPVERNTVTTYFNDGLFGDGFVLHSLTIDIGVGIDIQVLQTNGVIVYCQFDKEEFFEGHSYSKGYFSYEDNGFGPVCYELDTTVDAIIREIENDCKNSEEYIKRIEDFYEYFDTKSCKRVYEAIRALDEVK